MNTSIYLTYVIIGVHIEWIEGQKQGGELAKLKNDLRIDKGKGVQVNRWKPY
jgi:hypothetical protein